MIVEGMMGAAWTYGWRSEHPSFRGEGSVIQGIVREGR